MHFFILRFFGHFGYNKMTCFWCYQGKKKFSSELWQFHDLLSLFKCVGVLCFPFLTRFFFSFRNVELQQTYMPESLSRIKDYDMTCVAQFPLKKKHAPEEPKCRADILVYVAKDIIHVSILSILTASDTKTKTLMNYNCNCFLDKRLDKQSILHEQILV